MTAIDFWPNRKPFKQKIKTIEATFERATSELDGEAWEWIWHRKRWSSYLR